MDWGEVFFMLHKHCNLTKADIFTYTLPQVTDLIKRSNRYVQFEVESRLGMFGGMAGGQPSEGQIDAPVTEDGYTVMTEDDFTTLSKVLSGSE